MSQATAQSRSERMGAGELRLFTVPSRYSLDAVEETVLEFPAKKESIDFDGLLRFAKDSREKARKDYTPNNCLQSEFAEYLQDVKVVSFDIFDTALVRRVDHPVDVFFHLGQHGAFKAHTFAGSIAKLRVSAEQAARTMVFRVIASYEVNLLEIYQVFCDLNGISREYAESFVEAEEAIELELCAPCAAIHRLYEEAIERGRQAIFISDTYHRTEFLVRLLNAVGYPVDGSVAFASAEARKAKQNGELFTEVFGKLGIAPSAVLHVGDHPVSDYKRPKSLGIASLLHSHKASNDRAELFDEVTKGAQNDLLLSQRSMIRGLVRMAGQQREVGNDFWWRFGYSAVGPMTVGFCEWLEETMRNDGMEHAYFLLRDGELLHGVYQALFAEKAGACKATTLDSSRRAMLLPVAEFAPTFALPSLLGGIGKRPVREYLERMGVDADPFEVEARLAGLASLDELVDGRFATNQLVAFLVQKPVLTAVLERGRVEREALVSFLVDALVTSRERAALVDLGWGGTIHKSLQVLLMKTSPNTKLTGYYMATFPEAPHSVIPGLEVRSYLAERGKPENIYAQIVSFLNLFETVYTSNKGSVLHFAKGTDGCVQPVRQKSDKSKEQSRNLEAIHAGALAFAAEYGRLATAKGYAAMPATVASEEFFRVIDKPTNEEAELLGGLVHCDNLGSDSTHISAELREGAGPEELLEDFKEVHWKQGALSQATPTAARLRTLLWLMEAQA